MFDVDWNADEDVVIFDDLITLSFLEMEEDRAKSENVIKKDKK